ncbi:MAG: copper resistance protein CopC [Glaciimonas sp.]|nr:copper resistance protein CopC [Glaciimonas sp.]
MLRLDLPAFRAGTCGVRWTVVGHDCHRKYGAYYFTTK